MTLMLVPVARVQRKLTELSLRSTPPAGQALSLFTLGSEATPLARHYQQLHLQLGRAPACSRKKPSIFCTSMCRPCSARVRRIARCSARGARII